MKDHVTKFNVFIAIDNVRKDSEELARRLLGVGFTADSKILLTSRSEEVLRQLLSCVPKITFISLLPAPDQENALQIFEYYSGRSDLTTSLPVRDKICKVLEKYGKNHPLAFKALGLYARSLSRHSEISELDWSDILEGIDTSALQSVDHAIKLSYECLELHLKDMFLDIALWIRTSKHLYNGTHAIARQWLSILYKELSESQIDGLIYDLALNGVIQVEIDEDGEKMIRIHDVYVDLARKEASMSPRFLISTEKAAVEGMEWAKLERMTLAGLEDHRFIDNLQCCKSVQSLCASGIQITETHLKWMPSLRVLTLMNSTDLFMPSGFNLNSLKKLEYLWLEEFNSGKRLEGLGSLLKLQMLVIKDCPCLENVEGLGSLTQLKALYIYMCSSLKKIPDLCGMTGLDRLKLHQNGSLEEVRCLSPALKELAIERCGALKEMDLGGLTGLQSLKLIDNESLEKFTWAQVSRDAKITIKGCGNITGLGEPASNSLSYV